MLLYVPEPEDPETLMLWFQASFLFLKSFGDSSFLIIIGFCIFSCIDSECLADFVLIPSSNCASQLLISYLLLWYFLSRLFRYSSVSRISFYFSYYIFYFKFFSNSARSIYLLVFSFLPRFKSPMKLLISDDLLKFFSFTILYRLFRFYCSFFKSDWSSRSRPSRNLTAVGPLSLYSWGSP